MTTAADFRVDQVVHGYRSGHRLLSASVELDDRSAGTMLSLSDLVAEPTLSDSYLIGYPLKELNRYVVARTWLAVEMPRPGCVWTHSLLIDYASLARLSDLSAVTQLHRRPHAQSLPSYENSLEVTTPAVRLGRDSLDQVTAQIALSQIYGGDGHALIFGTDKVMDEALALAAWRQMWPRMRRSFFFCTSTAAPLAVVGSDCSLQILVGADRPSDGPATFDAGAIEGVAVLARDLPERRPTNLRRFLARYAPDFPDQQRSAPSLAIVFEKLSSAIDGREVDRAIGQIQTLIPPNQGRLLKGDLLLGRFREPTITGPLAVDDFNFSILRFADHPNPVSDEALRERMAALLVTGGLSAEKFIPAVIAAPPNSLGAAALSIYLDLAVDRVVEVEGAEPTKMQLARLRPDLLAAPQFWPKSAQDRSQLLDLALGSGLEPVFFLQMLLPTISRHELMKLAPLGGEEAVNLLLADLARGGRASEEFDGWCRLIREYPSALKRALGAFADQPYVLDELALAVLGSPAQAAFDNHVVVAISSHAKAYASEMPIIATIAFLQGMDASARKSSELISFGLDPILAQLERGNLPAPTISLLNQRLPWANYFSSGNLARRVMLAVALRYVAARKPENWILSVTKDIGVLAEILKIVESRLYGRDLLKDLYERARKKGGSNKPKIGVLEKVIWPYGKRR